MRKTYKSIALRQGPLSRDTLLKLRRLSQSTLWQMARLRHPLEKTSRTMSKEALIKILSEERWFPNDAEIKSR